MTSNITLTQHKEYDYETQAQLDRLWDSWSRYDQVCAEAGYENERYNAQADRLWAQYQTALDAAEYAQAQAEADEIVARHGDSIRRQISRAGFRQMSQRLTAVAQQAVQ